MFSRYRHVYNKRSIISIYKAILLLTVVQQHVSVFYMNSPLTTLGFTDNEIDVYVAVLKFGKISYSDVSKHTHLNRTTTYGIVRSLIKKGLIHEDIGSTKKYLVASEPRELLSHLEIEQKELDNKKSLALKAVEELSHIEKTNKHFAPRIRFIEEDKIEKFLFTQSAKWNNSIHMYDKKWWGFQDASSIKTYKKWLTQWQKEPSSKGIGARLITNLSETEKSLQNNHSDRIIKFWDADEERFDSTLWVAGDYVITIVSTHNPHYLIETHDPIMANNLRGVFKQLWKRL